MRQDHYFDWLVGATKTTWWHDSADPDELDRALEHGATGVTSNPVLSHVALRSHLSRWSADVERILADGLGPDQRASALMQTVLTDAAARLAPAHERSGGESGYVCAQVNPALAGDADAMLATAREYRSWAPNITVKLPATAAGLRALQTCVAEGISVTATVSFTVPQVLAIAESARVGIREAEQRGNEPGKCFAVIMIGRLDDYLRDVAWDCASGLAEEDIRCAGLAVTKRAYALYRERGYEATLIVAALRGAYHMTGLAGADLVMSIHPTYQDLLLREDLPRREDIDSPVPDEVVRRLSRLPEFVRSYEPDGMAPEEFISFGATQRTLAQFLEIGWKQLQGFSIS